MADELALQRLAARQHGLASREQLLRLGFTASQIRGRVERHMWHRIAPRVYDVAPASFDPLRSLHASVLAASGSASHRSAAHLWGFVDDLPPTPEILVPSGRTPKGLVAAVHRTSHLARIDRTTVAGMSCTTPLRTLHDLGSVVDGEALEDAVARAIGRRRTSARQLIRYVDRSLVGRPGGAALRTVAELYIDRRRETKSRLETIVDRAVRVDGIPRPIRQLRVRIQGRRFDLDLAWPSERVFVEADGYEHHSSPADLTRDRERQNLLVLNGWLPLRYTWRVARYQSHKVRTELLEALLLRRP